MNLYVGADISKGYADFCVMDGKGQVRQEVQLDDTRRGHDRMSGLIEELSKEVADEEELLVGMEATGGMEANWMQLFENLGCSGVEGSRRGSVPFSAATASKRFPPSQVARPARPHSSTGFALQRSSARGLGIRSFLVV